VVVTEAVTEAVTVVVVGIVVIATVVIMIGAGIAGGTGATRTDIRDTGMGIWDTEGWRHTARMTTR